MNFIELWEWNLCNIVSGADWWSGDWVIPEEAPVILFLQGPLSAEIYFKTYCILKWHKRQCVVSLLIYQMEK